MALAPARRRQRSVRVSVAVTLLAVGTLLVIAALPARSALWSGIAAVVALALAWAALRMMWTEVLQSRRDNARDRAEAASAYRTLFSERAAEHAEFTTAMTERLAQAQLAARELTGQLGHAHQRATTAEAQLVESNRRLDDTRAELRELVTEHEQLRTDHAEVLVAIDRLQADRLADLEHFEAQVQENARSGKHTRSA